MKNKELCLSIRDTQSRFLTSGCSQNMCLGVVRSSGDQQRAPQRRTWIPADLVFYYTKQKNQGPQICEGKYEGLDVLCSLRLLNPKSVAGNNGCGGGPGKAVCFEEIAAQFYMLLPSVQSGKWTLSLPFYTLSFS